MPNNNDSDRFADPAWTEPKTRDQSDDLTNTVLRPWELRMKVRTFGKGRPDIRETEEYDNVELLLYHCFLLLLGGGILLSGSAKVV